MFDVDFQSIQETELEAIRSIYGDDFVPSADSSAAFSLLLSGAVASLRMKVQLPAAYPVHSPVISFENAVGLSPHHIIRLQELVSETLAALPENTEAIFEIASVVENFLSENSNVIASDSGTENRRDAARLKEEEQKEEQRRKDQIAKANYENSLKEQVEEEMKRKLIIDKSVQDGRSLLWKVGPDSTKRKKGMLIRNSGIYQLFSNGYPERLFLRSVVIENSYYYKSPNGIRSLKDLRRLFQFLVKFKHEHVLCIYSIALESVLDSEGGASSLELTISEEVHESSLRSILKRVHEII